ncbi:MAG: response regulator transcription factor [Acholeplasmataceae bacterium]|nr:response regulator transcription factor [Acholeplasmataceae bacterium]
MIIYYVEDEKNLADLIYKYLVAAGYEAKLFYDGESALPHVGDEVDLWILDIMLPGKIDGFELIKEIKKKKPNTAVIFTSARDRAIDKVRGLELGSDDYLAKPYSQRELMLRIKAVLRRNAAPISNIIEYDKYLINTDKREIYKGDENIRLTNKEYELLYFFLNNKGEAFDRDIILRQVWGRDYDGSNRVVDDLLRRLRQKMPELRIETIYGHGYRLL